MRCLLLIFGLLSAVRLSADTLTVHNANEFLDAIRSNRVLILTADTFRLREADAVNDIPLEAEGKEGMRQINAYIQYLAGNGIAIRDVYNLQIIGTSQGKKRTFLVTKDLGDAILTFHFCKRIQISNVVAVHTPKTTGMCQGGVFFFSRCEQIHIQNCILKGSGAYGIDFKDVNNAYCKKVTFTECSSYFSEFKGDSAVHFDSCTFSYIKTTGSFAYFTNCADMQFVNCTFRNNYPDTRSGYFDSSMNYFFHFYRSVNDNPVILDQCLFEGNDIRQMTNNRVKIMARDLKFVENAHLNIF